MPGKDDEDWWRFLKLCTAAENPEGLNEVFELFLTTEERRDLKTLSDRRGIVEREQKPERVGGRAGGKYFKNYPGLEQSEDHRPGFEEILPEGDGIGFLIRLLKAKGNG